MSHNYEISFIPTNSIKNILEQDDLMIQKSNIENISESVDIFFPTFESDSILNLQN